MAARALAILAAVFLVAAVGLAALTSSELMLGDEIMHLDKTALEWVSHNSPRWLWIWVELPFLRRPTWLLPACIGVVFAGLATSLNFGKAPTSRRRRS